MKRSLKYLTTAFFALFIGGCVAACGESHTPDDSSTDLPALSTPTNVKADFWKLTWNEVENAAGYTVHILELDEKIETTETTLGLFEYLAPGKEYSIDVQAKGDGENYADSEWESIAYKTEGVTSGLTYTLLEDDTYEVMCKVSKIPDNGELVLPDTYAKKPITRFAPQKAFGGMYAYTDVTAVRLPAQLKEIDSATLYKSSISEIYLPESVEVLGGFAFSENLNLVSVILPNNIKEILGAVFMDCTALSEIVMPEGLTFIGKDAFKNTALTDVNVPKSVTTIHESAFDGTPWLENHADGLVYCGNMVYTYKGKMPENTVLNSLPSFVHGFAEKAFIEQTGLVGITVPDGVTEISCSIFSECVNLREVNLPKSVIKIGASAFNGCQSLTEIHLPENLKEIDSFAFQNSGLTSIDIPDGVVNLGNIFSLVFSGCADLAEVTLPDSLEMIGGQTFNNCRSLTKITFPNGLKRICGGAFYGCTALEEIVIPKSVTEISATAFSRSGLKKVVISNGVMEIGLGAFSGCETLESVIIPESVKFIYLYAFYNDNNLKNLYYEGTEEKWKDIEFSRECPPLSNEEAILAWMETWEENLTFYFYSETQPEGEGNYWHFAEDGKTPVIWE